MSAGHGTKADPDTYGRKAETMTTTNRTATRTTAVRLVDVREIPLDVEEVLASLDEDVDGMRVLEVKADRSSLRALHASIKAEL